MKFDDSPTGKFWLADALDIWDELWSRRVPVELTTTAADAIVYFELVVNW